MPPGERAAGPLWSCFGPASAGPDVEGLCGTPLKTGMWSGTHLVETHAPHLNLNKRKCGGAVRNTYAHENSTLQPLMVALSIHLCGVATYYTPIFLDNEVAYFAEADGGP